MTAHPVPTIDIAPFVRGSEDGRDSVARAVDQACTGFFAITGHGVCDELVAQLRGSAVDFFALPEHPCFLARFLRVSAVMFSVVVHKRCGICPASEAT